MKKKLITFFEIILSKDCPFLHCNVEYRSMKSSTLLDVALFRVREKILAIAYEDVNYIASGAFDGTTYALQEPDFITITVQQWQHNE